MDGETRADDGTCAIEVVHHETPYGGLASLNEIRAAADRVLTWCVESPKDPSEGGFVRRVGTYIGEGSPDPMRDDLIPNSNVVIVFTSSSALMVLLDFFSNRIPQTSYCRGHQV